jgi:hypothetical protein
MQPTPDGFQPVAADLCLVSGVCVVYEIVLDQSGVAGGDLTRFIGASHRGQGSLTSQSVVSYASIFRPDPDHHGRDRDAQGHFAHRLFDAFESQDRTDARNRIARP